MLLGTLVVGAAWLSAPATAGEGDPVEQLLARAADYDPAVRALAPRVRRLCDSDPLCAARQIVAAGDGRARLQRVEHPDTDSIRWVKTVPSVAGTRELDSGALLIVLDGFGRKALPELRAAMDGTAAGLPIVLDLRGNGGGDLGRMTQIAGYFLGGRSSAFSISNAGQESPVNLDGGSVGKRPGAVTVLVGPGTASSAEILAALLRRYAGAEILGQATAGKDYLTRIVAVDHDWRLLLPAERVTVPGESISGGLRPDGPIPADLAEAVAR